MLAAYAEQLGTCWIGFAQAYLNTAEGKAAVGIPEAWIPVAPIIVGRPQHASGSISRKDPEISLGGLSNRSSGRSRIRKTGDSRGSTSH